jgi:hypothetical protein
MIAATAFNEADRCTGILITLAVVAKRRVDSVW